MSQIPEVLSAREERIVRVLTVRDPTDQQVFRDLAKQGYTFSPSDPHEKLPYIVTVFARREVDLPLFRVDERMREQMIAEGVTFRDIEIARVLKFIPGGQWGASRGGVYFYLEHGPIVVSTTGNDALVKVTDAFLEELRDDCQNSHPENLVQKAVVKAMGPSMMQKIESIPVAVLSVPGSVMSDPSIARYFPDAKAVVDDYGQLLDFSPNDQKQRAAMTWQDIWPLSPK